MGRPRGKAKKSADDARDDDDGGSGREGTAPTDHRRSSSPLKPLRDDGADEEADDFAKGAEAADSEKPVVPTEDADSTVGGKVTDGGMKRPRRRRRRRRHLQVKRSFESVLDVGNNDGDDVRTKSNGFRRDGSRRKNSTPRRAAEAGVV
ncbi:hypothetical protein D1007_14397 [Hordeum vulgare]|uniref:Uncharacterized protein n=1 Tax=Hordeum vulgare subsp. vulgare TaxID=112509 RepID=A0A8I7BE68_HORVV|nr:uncharacterized protein LOC123407898 [Hordeum vulgare subsp. vulgare]KAE8808975.1 hypothetical protein D1007_14397 [Hordeum vulgare]